MTQASNPGPVERALALLKERIEESGCTMEELSAALGRNRSFLWRVLTGQQEIGLGELVEILEHLGEDPACFFTLVFGAAPAYEGHLQQLARRKKPESRLLAMERAFAEAVEAEPPAPPPSAPGPRALPAAALAERLLAAGYYDQRRRLKTRRCYRRPDVARAFLEGLDDLRYHDPDRAAKLAAATAVLLLPRLPGPREEVLCLHCFALGVFASAHRLIGEYPITARALRLAFEPAREHGLERARADLLQRATYLLAGVQDYEGALAVSGEALLIYTRLGDDQGRARAMADHGYALFHLGRFQEAQTLWEEALGLLEGQSATTQRYHFGLLQSLARLARDTGDYHVAERQIAAAKATPHDPRGSFAARLIWLEGNLAFDRGRLADAESLLTNTYRHFEEKGHPEAALVGVDLVELLLARGQRQRAQVLAVELEAWGRQLPGHKGMQAALAALARALVRGEVSSAFVEEIRSSLHRGACTRHELNSGKKINRPGLEQY